MSVLRYVEVVVGVVSLAAWIAWPAWSAWADDSPDMFPNRMQTSPQTQPGVHVTNLPNQGANPTNGALSPSSGSQMGAGVQFHFGGGSGDVDARNPAPKPSPSASGGAGAKNK